MSLRVAVAPTVMRIERGDRSRILPPFGCGRVCMLDAGPRRCSWDSSQEEHLVFGAYRVALCYAP